MTSSEFDAIFQGLRTRIADAGFLRHTEDALTKTFRGPHKCLLEFGAERYSDHLSIALAGPFSNENWLVFPFIADAVDPAFGLELRAAKDPRAAVLAVLGFVEKNLSHLTKNAPSYLDVYEGLLTKSGIPRLT